jgi:hypothetical protein
MWASDTNIARASEAHKSFETYKGETNMATTGGLLKEVQNEQARAKVGAFGSQGSGKTTTLALLALGVSKTFHGGAPVAMMDTENGSDYLKPIFDAECVKLLVHKSGAFSDMAKVVREAAQIGCCAFIMDSITHTWRELVESYCAAKAKKYNIQDYDPQFSDWKDIKKEWGTWTAVFLNAPLHCFIAGRAGYEYEFQINDKGKKELVKGDSKMKTEGEFGYEPSLLIEMEAIRNDTNKQHKGGSLTHIAHVLKDRARFLNGKQFEFADINEYKPGDWVDVYGPFEPHFSFLNIGGTQKAIGGNTSADLFDANGDGDRSRRMKEKTIACEEITATMQLLWPGQSAGDKAIRIRVLQAIFDTRSWSQVEGLPLEKLQFGLETLRRYEQKCKDTPGLDTEEGILNLIGICKNLAAIDGQNQSAAEQATGPVRANLPPFDDGKTPINLPPPPPPQQMQMGDDELRSVMYMQRNGTLVLSGDTFIVKDAIKRMGGRFDKTTKQWEVPATYLIALRAACDDKRIGLEPMD